MRHSQRGKTWQWRSSCPGQKRLGEIGAGGLIVCRVCGRKCKPQGGLGGFYPAAHSYPKGWTPPTGKQEPV